MWQVWWKTLGHLSQHISSPPSMHTAHQSSFGSSSFGKFLSSSTIVVVLLVPPAELAPELEPLTTVPLLVCRSVELCTCGEVVLPRCPSGSTCTPFESSFAIVAIRSFTESSQAFLTEHSPLFCWACMFCGMCHLAPPLLPPPLPPPPPPPPPLPGPPIPGPGTGAPESCGGS
uniref:Uncharacterized protein n=1 Tax=Anopheles melas TaxID=34690 RepID=A0A182TXV5_9DIPT